MSNEKFLESYNLINYLKIIDSSLLNLIDYININDSSDLVEVNDKLVLNLNDKIKNLLLTFIINNINDVTYYGKTNILIDTCVPKDNWRQIEQIVSKNLQKYEMGDDSIYIDPIKFNNFISYVFRKIEKNKGGIFNEHEKKLRLLAKNLILINFKSIDIVDSFSLISTILANFGTLNKDNFNYTLIRDGNHAFMHGGSLMSELSNEVRLQLINKGII